MARAGWPSLDGAAITAAARRRMVSANMRQALGVGLGRHAGASGSSASGSSAAGALSNSTPIIASAAMPSASA
jgi:hypothetical protein